MYFFYFFFQAKGLSPVEEDRLWQSGAFGAHSPEALRDAIWFLTTKCLGMRGRQESRQLKWGDFERKVDNFGNRFLEFQERTTKTRQGHTGDSRAFKPKLWPNVARPERCPLYLLDEYEKHRPLGMTEPESPFYLVVNHKRGPNSTCWYQRQAMGKNSLGSIMKGAAKGAGLEGKITNHSTRRTSISGLVHAGVPLNLVAQHSGHKNIQSVMAYSNASVPQQEAMFRVLSNNDQYSLPAVPASHDAVVSALPAPGRVSS